MGKWSDGKRARVAGQQRQTETERSGHDGSTAGQHNSKQPQGQNALPNLFRIGAVLALLFAVVGTLSTRADGENQALLPVIMVNPQPLQPLPEAVDDTYEAVEDTLLSVNAADGVLANDTHPDDLPLQAELVDDVANGVLTLNDDGSFDYMPDPDFSGEDSFTYRASDGILASNVATSLIAISVVNGPPVAVDDAYQVFQNGVLDVDAAAGVLANDTDPEMDPMTAVLINGVSNGSLTFRADGSFTYTPDAGFQGDETFTYQVTDGPNVSNMATVAVTVDDAPIAVDDSYTTPAGQALVVAAVDGVLANDANPEPGPLDAQLVTDVVTGTLALNDDGSFTYLPAAGFGGDVSFTYQANNGTAVSLPATATITVEVPPAPPVANNDAFDATEDTPLTVPALGVLANDEDSNGDALQALLVDNVSSGLLALSVDGSFVYTPTANFNGPDGFSYKASDATFESNVATVTITVAPVNDAPVAVNDDYGAARNTELVVEAANGVLANDSDPDGNALQAVLVNDVTSGQLTLNSDGSFSYQPQTDFAGQASFTYQATDGNLLSNVATVSLNVSGTNEPPEIVGGEIGFDKEVIGTDVREIHWFVPGDYDRDGDIDAVATDYVNGRVLLYTNDGSGSFTESVLDNNLEGAYPAEAGDVDGDGHMDVLAGGYLADRYVWYRNLGGGDFDRIVIDNNADGAHSIVPVDLDEDGDNDLVVADQDSAEIGWYENDGSNNFQRRTFDTTAEKAKRAEVADMDGDGDLDVVTASYAVDEIAWFENDGEENFTKFKVNETKRNGAYHVSLADVDGDGKPDILTASKLDNTIAWYRNNGDGTFDENIIDDAAEGARTVLGVDLDRDGDIDALAASREDDTLAWHENDGTGKFTTHFIDTAIDGAYGVAYIDVDFDGDLDVFAAARVSHEAILYTQFPAIQATVQRGGSLLIDDSLLLTVDPDDGPTQLTYELMGAPTNGELKLNGALLDAGDTFTQQQVNDGLLEYTHTGSRRDPDSFKFSVKDGGENGVQPVDGLFLIEVVRPSAGLVMPPL